MAEEDLSPQELRKMYEKSSEDDLTTLQKIQEAAANRAKQLSELLLEANKYINSQRKSGLAEGMRGSKSWYSSIFNDKDNSKEVKKRAGLDVEEKIPLQVPVREGEFLEALGTCTTFDCVRMAHQLKKDGDKMFNFPHALLVGWQKAATTSIYQHLHRHPDVLASSTKEPEFFSRKCEADPRYGCSKLDQAQYLTETLQMKEFVDSQGSLMAFEASTHYAMNGDVLAKGIVETFPWVKIVASLREPISRAASMLVHMYDREKTGCLREPHATLYGCLKTRSQLVGHPGPFNNIDSLVGNYSYALEHWIKDVPRGQLALVQYEQLIEGDEHGADVLLDLKEFLDLNPSQPKDSRGLGMHNVRHNRVHPEGWMMKKEEYLDLIDMVKPDVEQVAELVSTHGLGDGKKWMDIWEGVWEDNLKNCDKKGVCLIHLS